jgi:hypothetical protein
MPTLSDGEVLRRLSDRAAAIFCLVDCIAYVDTVTIHLPRRLGPDEYHQVRETCYKISSWKSKKPGMYVYRIQLPSIATLRYIALSFPSHIVTRFDVALDFITTTQLHASRIRSFLRMCVTQPRRGRTRMNLDTTTVYFCGQRARRNIVIYATKPSKITGTPAAHLELRYSNARACKSRGIRKLIDLENYNISDTLSRDVRISDINWAKADRIVDSAAANTVRWHHLREARGSRRSRTSTSRISKTEARRSIENNITRQLADEDHTPTWDDLSEYPVQQCIDCYRVLRRATVHLPMTSLINTPLRVSWS